MNELIERMTEAVDDYNAGKLSDDAYKKIMEGITFTEYRSVFACCFNCAHWTKTDGRYEYEGCVGRNPPIIVKCAYVCEKYSGAKSLFSPIHNIDRKPSEKDAN